MIHLCTITEPLEGESGTYCPTCCRILPDAHFKRLLTPAQARARGFTREGERVYERWRECKACSPPPRRKTAKTMTSHQIMREVAKGNLRAAQANYAVELARKRENEARRQGVLRRWDAWWAARWDYARDRLRRELETTTQRIFYARDNPPLDDPACEVEAFLREYRQTVRALISWCTDMRRLRALGRAHARAAEASERLDTGWGERRRGRPPKTKPTGDRRYVMDQHSQWADYIRAQDLNALRERYLALPTKPRAYRLSNPPLLLLSSSDADVHCLHGYPEFADRDASRQRMAALKG